MKTTVEIDSDRPDELLEILRPSLESGEDNNYSLEQREETVKITVETDGLGPLRGCTDTVFRLTSLAKKLY